MARVEIKSVFTGEVIGYFGDSTKEKSLCSSALSKVDIVDVYESGDLKTVYVKAFMLPEM